MENSRLIFAVIVAMAVLFAYEQFLQHRYPNLYGPKAHHSPATSPSGIGAATPIVPAPNASESAAPFAAGSTPSTGAITAAPERTFEVSSDLFDAIFTSRGARLVSFKLKKYRETGASSSPPYEMLRPGDRMPFGVIVARGGETFDDANVEFTTDAPATIDVTGPTTVRFSGALDNGIKLDKSFRFEPSSYAFGLAVTATGEGATPLSVGITMSQPLTALAGYRDYPEVQSDVQGKATNELEKALRKGTPPRSGKISYAGFGDRYFLTALIPQNPSDGTLTTNYSGAEADAAVMFDKSTVESRVYMGPKELEGLEHVDPSLSKAIDLGFWGIIALPFLRLLKIFYHIVPNYGVAIILLTIVVRLATLPMSIKGQRSMMRMQRLQPQVERIRERFKDDSEKLNREMMELYKRNHVNPLGGCLPMVIQFPVFIGLYEALLNAVALRHAPFVGWIQDLSAPDCLHIPGMPQIPLTTCHGIPVLVALMTLSAFLQQWLMPRQADPSQQKMMMYMPVMFSLIFLSLPSGLSLYYFASNLLGIAQQVILNREFKQPSPEVTK